MKTKVIQIEEDQARKETMRLIKQGAVVAVPTDTVYGIACDVFNPKAIDQIYEIKGRERTKAIPVLMGEFSQFETISKSFSPSAKKLASVFWPGALTLVVKKNQNLPENLSVFPTVGIRIPDHDWLRELLNSTGPLAATSANLSGEKSPTTPEQVMDQLAGRIELIIDGGRCEGGIPSTVVDTTSNSIKILRQGGISEEAIFKTLEK